MDPRGKKNRFYVFIGPSGSGKTTAVVNLVAGGKFTLEEPIGQMLVVSKHPEQEAYLRLAGAVGRLTFLRPSAEVLEEEAFLAAFNLRGDSHAAVLFDDVESERLPQLHALLAAIATRLAHHKRFSAFLTAHSIFYNNDTYRLIQKNASYLCFMQQVRERNSIRHLSQQIFCSRLLSDAFDCICRDSDPHEYLILDLEQSTNERLRLRQSFDIRQPLVTFETREDGDAESQPPTSRALP